MNDSFAKVLYYFVFSKLFGSFFIMEFSNQDSNATLSVLSARNLNVYNIRTQLLQMILNHRD